MPIDATGQSTTPVTARDLYAAQQKCVSALQKRLTYDAQNRIPSGEVKDVALALGCAVDKLMAMPRNTTVDRLALEHALEMLKGEQA